MESSDNLNLYPRTEGPVHSHDHLKRQFSLDCQLFAPDYVRYRHRLRHPRQPQYGYQNSYADDTEGLINSFNTLGFNSGELSTPLSRLREPQQIHVSFDNVLVILKQIQALTVHIFQYEKVFSNYFQLLDGNPLLLSVLISIDSDLAVYQDNLSIVYNKFQQSFYSTLVSQVLLQCLLSFKDSIDEQFLAQRKYELHLPIFKLEKFGSSWNLRNNVDIGIINNIVPNAITDILQLPVLIPDANLVNMAYLYNCLLHYSCYHEDISQSNGKLNLIWHDKISKLKLNNMIYVQLFSRIDSNFKFILQSDNTPLKNSSSGGRNITAKEYFTGFGDRFYDIIDETLKTNPDIDQLMGEYLASYNESLWNLHVNNLQEIVLLSIYMYDMPIEKYINHDFPDGIFEFVARFFQLQIISPAVQATYETRSCLAYLKFLRLKNFILNNDEISSLFGLATIKLEKLLSFKDADPMEVLLNFAQFFKMANIEDGFRGVGGYYGEECIKKLIDFGLDSTSVVMIKYFGYYDYIAFQ